MRFMVDYNMRYNRFMVDSNMMFMVDMDNWGNGLVDDDVVLYVRLPVFDIFRLSVSNRDLGLLDSVP
jgi:hypothetical protein